MISKLPTNTVTLADIEAWRYDIEPHLARSTVQRYIETVMVFYKWLNLRPVTQQVVDEWTSELLRGGRRNSTVDCIRRGVAAHFAWRIENETWNGRNPVRRMRSLTIDTVSKDGFTEDEYRRIRAHLAGKWLDKLAVIGWNTGLRLGDCSTLRWSDVNEAGREIVVVPHKTSGRGKRVFIPYGDELAEMFRSEIHRGKYVTTEAAGYFLTGASHYVSTKFRMELRRIGIATKTFHCFRHAFVTRHLNSGASPAVLATVTGHSLNRLMIYAHVSGEARRRALNLDVEPRLPVLETK